MDKEEMMQLFSRGGMFVAGDVVMEKHVNYEVSNVESGGIGIQVVNKVQEEETPLTDQEEQIVQDLMSFFWGEREEVLKFLKTIKGMKDVGITNHVRLLVSMRIIDETSCHRQLWSVMHKYGLYMSSESNWNNRLR